MSRKNSHIPSLLAARLRTPPRKPPAREPLGGSHLRLVREHPEAAPKTACEAKPRDIDLSQAAAIRGDLEQAAIGLGRVLELLEALQAISCEPVLGQRRSPGEADAQQQRIQGILDQIDQIADGAESSGVKLLDGSWRIRLAADESLSFDVASVHTSQLGEPKPLSSLRGAPTDSSAVHAGATRALAQAAGLQKSLLEFAGRVGRACLNLAAVIAENQAAMESAIGDAAFAALSGSVTRGDVLIERLAQKRPSPPGRSS